MPELIHEAEEEWGVFRSAGRRKWGGLTNFIK